ncbi:hypothetical protein TIFTF001_037395 [Ficus carica]|uniref:Uncharacterized protein n=1 Tax=Ficus carica TaxID=3494 RepID=A0AA88E5H6_FICCA|nr:hypothetical protein TIFTF001_037395 [Ficus carica]
MAATNELGRPLFPTELRRLFRCLEKVKKVEGLKRSSEHVQVH